MLPETTPEIPATALPAADPAAAEPAAPPEVAAPAATAEAEVTPDPTAGEPAPDAAEAAAVAAGEAEAAAGEAPAAADPAAPPPPADLSPAVCAAQLAALFPALFGAGRALPIKLRIQADIQQRAPGLFNRRTLSVFLHRHTTGNAYIRALVQATQRFDLDGQPAGEVTEEHRAAATAELERRRGIVEARRAAEREAQRLAPHGEAPRREPAPPPTPEELERRERAQLLRAFETSTLTRANFCTLKGLDEATLEARLAQARQERAERPPQVWADARGPRPAGGRPPQGHREGAPRRRPRGRPPGPREA